MCEQTVNNRPNANSVLTFEKNGVYYNQSRGCDKSQKGKKKHECNEVERQND